MKQLKNQEKRHSISAAQSDFDYIQRISKFLGQSDTLSLHQIVVEHEQYLKLLAKQNMK